MTGATMFSGIGAPECAAPWIDWKWHAEIEKFPAAVHSHHFPQSSNLGDVTAPDFIERAKLHGPIDVLVFGSPCQSFSVAGKRLGLGDPRGNLALIALRIIDQIRPKWFIFENVPGLLSSDEGRDFGAFLGLVGDIRYHGSWAVLDAQWFGVAQRRRRLFFVGNSGDWRYPAALFSECHRLSGDNPPSRETREEVAGTISSRASGGGGGPGAGTHEACAPVAMCLNAKGGAGRLDGESETLIAGTLAASGAGTAMPAGQGNELDFLVTHSLRGEGFDASEDGTGRGTPLVPIAFNLRGREGGSLPEITDVASLRAASGGSSRSYVANTLKSNNGGGGFGSDPSETFIPEIGGQGLAMAVRRLTPL